VLQSIAEVALYFLAIGLVLPVVMMSSNELKLSRA
jgi:hypothetical protein